MTDDGARSGGVDRITDAARDALTVRRAYGEPIVHGDVTVIPVARVRGGTGSAFGAGAIRTGATPAVAEDAGEAPRRRPAGRGDGGAGGFGASVRPLGVYVVHGEDAQWQPALDVTKVALAGQLVGVVAILATSHVLRRWLALRAGAGLVAAPVATRRPLPLRLLVGTVRHLPRPRLPRPSLARLRPTR